VLVVLVLEERVEVHPIMAMHKTVHLSMPLGVLMVCHALLLAITAVAEVAMAACMVNLAGLELQAIIMEAPELVRLGAQLELLLMGSH
jgi:hypothetical protein